MMQDLCCTAVFMHACQNLMPKEVHSLPKQLPQVISRSGGALPYITDVKLRLLHHISKDCIVPDTPQPSLISRLVPSATASNDTSHWSTLCSCCSSGHGRLWACCSFSRHLFKLLFPVLEQLLLLLLRQLPGFSPPLLLFLLAARKSSYEAQCSSFTALYHRGCCCACCTVIAHP